MPCRSYYSEEKCLCLNEKFDDRLEHGIVDHFNLERFAGVERIHHMREFALSKVSLEEGLSLSIPLGRHST